MENKVLQKNLDYIACYDKELSDKILMFDIEKSNIKLTTTNKGEYNIIHNEIELHNKDGAIDEAQKIASK